MWLERPLTLAFPAYRSDRITNYDGRDVFANALAAFSHDDRTATNRLLNSASRARNGIRPRDLTLDRLAVEAWARSRLGDTSSAVHAVEPTLEALAFTEPEYFASAEPAASFARSAVLLPRLLARRDPAAARGYARAALALGLQAYVSAGELQRVGTDRAVTCVVYCACSSGCRNGIRRSRPGNRRRERTVGTCGPCDFPSTRSEKIGGATAVGAVLNQYVSMDSSPYIVRSFSTLMLTTDLPSRPPFAPTGPARSA